MQPCKTVLCWHVVTAAAGEGQEKELVLVASVVGGGVKAVGQNDDCMKARKQRQAIVNQTGGCS